MASAVIRQGDAAAGRPVQTDRPAHGIKGPLSHGAFVPGVPFNVCFSVTPTAGQRRLDSWALRTAFLGSRRLMCVALLSRPDSVAVGPAACAGIPHCAAFSATAKAAGFALRRRRDGCGLPRWDDVPPRCQRRGSTDSYSGYTTTLPLEDCSTQGGGWVAFPVRRRGNLIVLPAGPARSARNTGARRRGQKGS
jgi:hypothetical protein